MPTAPSACSDTSHISELTGFSDGGPVKQHLNDDEAAHHSVLETTPVQTTLFGILYAVQKVRLDAQPAAAVAHLVLDYLQLLLLVLQPAFGYHIHTNLWPWKVVNWAANFGRRILDSQSYELYTGCILLAACVLLLCLALCVWAGWSFNHPDRAKAQWPIALLRALLQLVVVTYFVATLGLLMSAADCRWEGSLHAHQVPGTLAAYPTHRCLSSSHLAYLAVALFSSTLLVLLALVLAVGDAERNPISRRWLATAQTGPQMAQVAVKALMVVVASTLQPYGRVQAVVLAAAATYLVFSLLTEAPYMTSWINHTRVALNASAALPSLLLVPMRFAPGTFVPATLTTVLLCSLLPAMPLAFLLSHLHAWRRLRTIRHAIRSAPEGTKAHLVYAFQGPEEVEFASRVMRRWVKGDRRTLESGAVTEAEAVIKLGLLQFPGTAGMTLLSSNFLIHAADGYHTGYSQALAAKKQAPTLSQRFLIFVRETDHQAAATSGQGQGSAMDMAAYVEFQRQLRVTVRSHKAALLAVRNFWKLLLHSNTSFRQLATSIQDITTVRRLANQMYRSVLERYPMSARLVRNYARFLEEVHNDPWAAERMLKQADKLDAEAHEGGAQDDDRWGVGVKARSSAIVVVDYRGSIKMANKVAAELFGWRKGDLEGKNVAVLVPPPYSLAAHIATLQKLAASTSTATTEKALHTVEAAAIHKGQRYMFPVNLSLTKPSGSGDDAGLMIIIQAIAPEPGVVTVWALPDGTIASVGANFSDVLGGSPEEWLGRSVTGLATDPAPMQALLHACADAVQDPADLAASSGSEADAAQTAGVEVACAGRVAVGHKFCHPVFMNICATLGGSEAAPVLIFKLRRSSPADHLSMVVDHVGRILYITTPLAASLGHTPSALLAARATLDSLMPQPWAQLHCSAHWLRGAAVAAGGGGGRCGNGAAGSCPGGSCRVGATIQLLVAGGQKQLPASLSITTRGEDEESLAPTFVVDVTPSTVKAGLDQRRLRIEVAHNGVVTSVGNSPQALFGFDPAALVGRALSDFIDVLRLDSTSTATAKAALPTETPGNSLRSVAALPEAGDTPREGGSSDGAAAGESGPPAGQAAPQVSAAVANLLELAMQEWALDEEHGELAMLLAEGGGGHGGSDASAGDLLKPPQDFSLEQLLALMVLSASHQPGASWRVGVHAPKSQEDIRAMSPLSATLFLKKTRPAILEVAAAQSTGVQPAGEAADPAPGVTLHLWRADLVCGVVEVNTKDAAITRITDPHLHPPGLLLGVPAASLVGWPVGQLFATDAAALLSVDESHHRGGMKSGGQAAAHGRVGPLRQVAARHADGRDVWLTAQAVEKRGASRVVYLVLRLVAPQLGDPAAFLHQLCTGLCRDASPTFSPVPPTLPAQPPSGSTPRGAITRMATMAREGTPLRPSVKIAVQASQMSRANSPTTGVMRLSRPNASASQVHLTGDLAAAGVEARSGSGMSDSSRDGDNTTDGRSSRKSASTHQVDEWVSATNHANNPLPVPYDPPAPTAPPRQLFTRDAARSEEPDDGHLRSSAASPVPTLSLSATASARTSMRARRASHRVRCPSDEASCEEAEQSGAAHERDAGETTGSEAATAEEGDAGATHQMDEDAYRDAKRSRKLAMAVCSGTAQADVQRYKWHSAGLWLLLVGGMVVCYITMVSVVNKQTDSFKRVELAGRAAQTLGRIPAAARVLDNLQLWGAMPPNPLYGPASLPAFNAELDEAVVTLTGEHQGIYLGAPITSPNLTALWNRPSINVTTMYNTNPPSLHVTLMSAWSLGNLYLSNAREVWQHNADWHSSGTNVSSHTEFYFLLANFGTLSVAYANTLIGYDFMAIAMCDHITGMQETLFMAYGLGVCSACVLYALLLLWRVSDQRYRLFSVFLTVPQGFVRTLAAKEINLGDDSDDDEAEDNAVTQPLLASSGRSGGGRTGAGDFVAVTVGRGGPTPAAAEPAHAWHRGVRRQCAALLSTVQFWRPLVAPGGKHSMSRDSRATSWLVTPFVVWLAMAVAMFVMNIRTLSGMKEPTEMLMACNFVPLLMTQAISYAHEACSSTSIAAIYGNLGGLAYINALIGGLWTVMMAGNDASGVHSTNPMGEYIMKGLPFYSPTMSNILYEVGSCTLAEQSLCSEPGDKYYEIQHSGLDAMLQRFMAESNLLIADNPYAMNLQNSRLQYMWQVGRADVTDGLDRVKAEALVWAMRPLEASNRHMLIFLVTCALMALLYTVFFTPLFIGEVGREARRVAQLLSQLPKGAGMEEAVERILGLGPRSAPPAPAAAAAIAPAAVQASGESRMPPRSPRGRLSVELARQGSGSGSSTAALLSGGNGRMSRSGAAQAEDATATSGGSGGGSGGRPAWLSWAGNKVSPRGNAESGVSSP